MGRIGGKRRAAGEPLCRRTRDENGEAEASAGVDEGQLLHGVAVAIPRRRRLQSPPKRKVSSLRAVRSDSPTPDRLGRPNLFSFLFFFFLSFVFVYVVLMIPFLLFFFSIFYTLYLYVFYFHFLFLNKYMNTIPLVKKEYLLNE